MEIQNKLVVEHVVTFLRRTRSRREKNRATMLNDSCADESRDVALKDRFVEARKIRTIARRTTYNKVDLKSKKDP